MSGRLFGLGVGPGDPELLTLKALRILRSAPVIAYLAAEDGPSLARRIVESHLPEGQEEIEIRMPMRVERAPAEAAYEAAAARMSAILDGGRDVAVLCEGDPFFYGSFMYLFERLAARHPTEIVPGISSLNAAAALALRPLAARNDTLAVIPAPLGDAAIEDILARAEGFAILKIGRHMARIQALLARLGLAEGSSYVERATQAGERVMPLAEAPAAAPYFSLILGYRGAEPALLGRTAAVARAGR